MHTLTRTHSTMRDAEPRFRQQPAHGKGVSSHSHDMLQEGMYTSSLRLNLAPQKKTPHFIKRGSYRRKSSPDAPRAPSNFSNLQLNTAATVDELCAQQNASKEAIALFLQNKRKAPMSSLSSRSLSSLATNPPTVKEEEEVIDILPVVTNDLEASGTVEVVIDDDDDDGNDHFTLMDFLKSTQVVDILDQEMSLTDFLRVSEDFGPGKIQAGPDSKGSISGVNSQTNSPATDVLSCSSSNNSMASGKSLGEAKKATLCSSPRYDAQGGENPMGEDTPESKLKAPDGLANAKRTFVHRSKSINNIENTKRSGSFKGLLRSKSNTASDRVQCAAVAPALTPTQILTQTSLNTGVHEVPIKIIHPNTHNNCSHVSLTSTRNKPRAERVQSMGQEKDMRIGQHSNDQQPQLRKQSAPVSSRNSCSNSSLGDKEKDSEREFKEKDIRSSPKSPTKHISRAWKRVTEIKSSFISTPSSTDGDNSSNSQIDSNNGEGPIFGTYQTKVNNAKCSKTRECVTWGGVDSVTAKTPQHMYKHIRAESKSGIPLSASDEGSEMSGACVQPPLAVARQRRSLPMNELAPLNADSVTCDKVFLHDELFEGCCNNTTGLAQGLGIWADKDDSTYAGEWFEGEPHGFGSYASLSRRCWFEGRFVKGQAHGFGKLLFIDRYTLDPVYFYGEFRFGRYIHGSLPKDERQRANNAVIIARRASFCANKQSGEAMRSIVTNRLQTWTRRIVGQPGSIPAQHCPSPRIVTSVKASFYWLDNPVLKCQVYLPQITTEAVVARGGHIKKR
ncbi:hypothetical protein SARC_00351 [Sphaeroforma arctica JP610]|uniref:Uncharacterized protein n=1 Tax=Sphaeroforma arctica JP610 TaxID=667725 RepID=A0A0L0GEU3_9EUKA|nr:hypothetical protein SARC_00351 [Sphaeroforma arctica JP610]KNC87527.1 hypothetical protein SARC_00351 [Sphaeroforma arctica JP610]|eukprot:XP_014161429.1 hypothetical protein SARC_00351 [Sphaeroforma arctica JP610]